MATVELTQDNFKQTIDGNAIVLVDFWADWCGPCRAFAPTFEAASEQHPNIVFAKINTEEQQELAAAFNIRSIPTLMAFREQIVVFAEAGALPAASLQKLIEGIVGLDMNEVRAAIAEQHAEEGKSAQ